ncbi:MAG: MFS transporter [Acidimicrobiia bacterium]|jgi:MFS family permease
MSARRVLGVRGFPMLLAGETINATGSWVAVIAIWGFAAFKFDAGPGDLALLFVVLSVPGALLGPLLGVPIDRFGPKRMLVVANLLGMVDAIALTRAHSYLSIILLALPLGLIEALAAASLDSIPPRLMDDEHLVTANAFLGGAQDLAIIAGPVLAAVVNAHWGLTGAFLVDAGTFLVGALVAMGLRVPPALASAEEAESPWREVRAGLTLVRRSDGLRWTLGVVGSVYLLWALFGLLEPLYVRDVLGESDTVFALLQTVYGIGLVGAGLALAAIGDRVARPRYVAFAIVASGATAALYVGTQSLIVAGVGVFLWGADVAFFYVPAKTLLQRYAPMEFHGRVLSLNQSLEPAAGMIVTPLGAFALGVVGVQLLGVLGGAVAAIGGLVALRVGWRLVVPAAGPVDPTAGSSRDAIALGGSAPG